MPAAVPCGSAITGGSPSGIVPPHRAADLMPVRLDQDAQVVQHVAQTARARDLLLGLATAAPATRSLRVRLPGSRAPRNPGPRRGRSGSRRFPHRSEHGAAEVPHLVRHRRRRDPVAAHELLQALLLPGRASPRKNPPRSRPGAVRLRPRYDENQMCARKISPFSR